MPELGPQTLRDASVASSTARPTSIPRRARRRCKRAVDRRPRPARPPVRSSPPDSSRPTREASAVATSNGLFAYHRDDRRELLGDGANAGRHRQRMGERRRARLGQGRSRGDRAHGGAEGGGEPQSAGDRARAVHGRARAAGGHRPRAAARRRVQRAHAPTKGAARSPSPAAARGSARRWSTSASRSTPIRRIPDCSASRSTPKGCRSPHRLDRERHPEESLLHRFWAQKQGKQPTGNAFMAGGLALTGGTKTTERADRRLRARHPRHALLLHPLARSAHGAAHRPHARRHVPDREGQDHAAR